MRTGALLSLLLHGVILLLLWTGIHSFFRHDVAPPSVIPVEVINISDITQARALKARPKVAAEEEPKKEDKPTPPKPEPEPEPKPEPEPEPEPEPKADKPDVTLDELLAAIPEEKSKKKEKEKEKKKKEKDKEKKKKKKKKKDFQTLLNSIEKESSKDKGPVQKEQDKDATEDQAASNVGDELSVTDLDLIQRQFRACWNLPAGARDAKDLYVDVQVEMNPDATVKSAVVLRIGGDAAYHKVAADSALRAVNHPNCNPLRVPLDRYDVWKSLEIHFDPKHIL